MTQAATPQPAPGSRLGRFLLRHGDDILDEWLEDVCQLIDGEPPPEPELVDHVPDILGALAKRLNTGQRDPLFARLAREHSQQRLDIGFNLDHVTREYAALHAAIYRVWQREHGDDLTVTEVLALDGAVDEALTEAAQLLRSGSGARGHVAGQPDRPRHARHRGHPYAPRPHRLARRAAGQPLGRYRRAHPSGG